MADPVASERSRVSMIRSTVDQGSISTSRPGLWWLLPPNGLASERVRSVWARLQARWPIADQPEPKLP